MKLTEHKFGDLSKIVVRYFIGNSLKKMDLVVGPTPYTILVLKYSGVFGWGSGGRGDGTWIGAMAKAGIHAFQPDGIIHDVSELNYEWGDDLLPVLLIGPEKRPEARAVMVGPKCEEAVRTLCHGTRSTEPLEKIGWVFRDLDAARDHVDKHIDWFGR